MRTGLAGHVDCADALPAQAPRPAAAAAPSRRLR